MGLSMVLNPPFSDWTLDSRGATFLQSLVRVGLGGGAPAGARPPARRTSCQEAASSRPCCPVPMRMQGHQSEMLGLPSVLRSAQTGTQSPGPAMSHQRFWVSGEGFSRPHLGLGLSHCRPSGVGGPPGETNRKQSHKELSTVCFHLELIVLSDQALPASPSWLSEPPPLPGWAQKQLAPYLRRSSTLPMVVVSQPRSPCQRGAEWPEPASGSKCCPSALAQRHTR